MADPKTPGVETSEYSSLQKFINWTIALAGSLSAGIIALLATGIIPADHSAVAVLGTVATVLGAIAGKAIAQMKYNGGRTALKLEKLAKMPPENPPPAT